MKRIITYTNVTAQRVDANAQLGDLRRIIAVAGGTAVTIGLESGMSPVVTVPANTALDIGETDLSKLHVTASGGGVTIALIVD